MHFICLIILWYIYDNYRCYLQCVYMHGTNHSFLGNKVKSQEFSQVCLMRLGILRYEVWPKKVSVVFCYVYWYHIKSRDKGNGSQRHMAYWSLAVSFWNLRIWEIAMRTNKVMTFIISHKGIIPYYTTRFW